MINIYYNSKEIITFDIETSSLSAPEGEFVCSCVAKMGVNKLSEECYFIEVQRSLRELNNYFHKLKKQDNDYLIVTWNGENYKTSFDFPWLRTQFALNDLYWGFEEFQHLDFYPLTKRYFNNKFIKKEPASVSSLYKNDLEKLAVANGLGYTTKKETYKSIKELENPEWLNYIKEKREDRFDEQSVYQTFCDPEGYEDYIDGSEVIELYKEGEIDKIIKHNRQDVRRLYDLVNLLLDYIPEYEIQRNINTL